MTTPDLITSSLRPPQTTMSPSLLMTPGFLSSQKNAEADRKQRKDYVDLANPMIGIIDSEVEISTVETDISPTTELEIESTVPADSLEKPDPWDSDADLGVTSSGENATTVFNSDDLNAQNQSLTTETNLVVNNKITVSEAAKINVSVHSFHSLHSKNKKHLRRISKSYVRIKHIDIPSRHIITSVPHPFVSNYKTTASTLLKRIMADPPFKLKNRSSFKSDTFLHRDRSEHNRLGNTHTGKSGSDMLPSLTSVIMDNKDYRKHSPNKRISIGIPASSRVSTRFLGLPKTTPTVSPVVSTSRETLVGPALPDSDEYYSSYVEYPDLTSANMYNNTGIQIF